MEHLLVQLSECLGDGSVLTGDDARERMAPGSRASILLLPRTTEDVSRALALCHAAHCPVVPQGGLTGLVDGALAGAGEIALSLQRMRDIDEVDVANRSLSVQAGVPLQAAQEAARAHGFLLGLDLGARGSATIGGNVATNAGGMRVLRFGMMREMVLGLEAVLADGTVIDARSKMLKNNTGYDLKQLFIGSEGTLGIVTRVVLRLRPLPRSQSTALVAIDDFEHVARFLTCMEAQLPDTLSSFEVMWREFYALMTTPPSRGRAALPQGHSYYVLIETLGTEQAYDDDRLVRALDEASRLGYLAGAVVAHTAAERRELWSVREDLAPLNHAGPVFAYDVSLGVDAMEQYIEAVKRELRAQFSEPRAHVFGHLADGNLHLSIGVGAGDARAHHAVDAIVYGALPSSDSSVSAEHGVGLFKKPYLWHSRSAAELGLMRTLKRALDPRGILNPGKIFECTPSMLESTRKTPRDGGHDERTT